MYPLIYGDVMKTILLFLTAILLTSTVLAQNLDKISAQEQFHVCLKSVTVIWDISSLSQTNLRDQIMSTCSGSIQKAIQADTTLGLFNIPAMAAVFRQADHDSQTILTTENGKNLYLQSTNFETLSSKHGNGRFHRFYRNSVMQKISEAASQVGY